MEVHQVDTAYLGQVILNSQGKLSTQLEGAKTLIEFLQKTYHLEDE